MKKILLISAFLMSMTLISCSEGLTSDKNEIKFNVSYPNSTKVTSSNFESGDAISLYAVEYDGENQIPLQISGNFINNERVEFNGTSWASSRSLYWSSKDCDFYALYPYQASINSVESYPFSVAADQTGDGYEASDLLFAFAEKCSRTDGAVNLNFKHMMSKLVVTITKGAKFDGEIPNDIVTHVYNTNVDCSVNLTTGSVEKNPFSSKKTITMKKIDNTRFEAVVLPQNLEKKTPLVEITMGGIAYLLETNISFRPGYVHTINVTVNTSPDQEQIEISIDPNKENWN